MKTILRNVSQNSVVWLLAIGGVLMLLVCPGCITMTALASAAAKGDLADVSRLVESGTPVDDSAGGEGTPLFMAAACNELEIAKYLLDHGANPNG